MIYNKERRTLDASKQMLEEVLRTQAKVRRNGPNPEVEPISEADLHEIRCIWRPERQDWEELFS